MPKEMRFSRLLPLALALALIGLTALWGGWLATGSGSAGQGPFALSAALWPLLAWAGCGSRRRAARTPPRHPHASVTPATAAAVAASPEPKRESTGERSPEFAGAFKR
jgi:hypothetical protein